jgi:5-methylcytosine-specific restriction enzyme subunit McrC
MSTRELRLSEWSEAVAGTPAGAALDGVYLEDPAVAEAVRALTTTNALQVWEGRHGLGLRARQHVGVVQIGPVRVTVTPKLPTDALWTAVAYTLGLEAAVPSPPAGFEVDRGFVDLLALLLLEASEALWRSGVHRAHVEREGWLAAPRGRVDTRVLARATPLTRAALPCRYFAFEPHPLLNGVVVAGLELASELTEDLRLRGALHRAVQTWRMVSPPVRLNHAAFSALERSRSRLSARYDPTHALVRMLWEGAGLPDDLDAGATALPGRLWDMARLYERFVARFLSENLTEAQVDQQEGLDHLYEVEAGSHKHRAPRPRPDLVLRVGGRPVAVLDTKYRDVWKPPLPEHILYQMSVYALAWPQAGQERVPAVVLYPSEHPHPDVRYRLNVADGGRRDLVLRALNWGGAARLIRDRAPRSRLVEVATRWAFGAGACADAAPPTPHT